MELSPLSISSGSFFYRSMESSKIHQNTETPDKDAVIFCSGPMEYEDIRQDKVELCFKVAVDGGLQHFEKLGIIPDEIVGDFDSVPKELLTKYKVKPLSNGYYEYQGKFIRIHELDRDKDVTDTEYAVNQLRTKNFKRITILGGVRGRTDHLCGNINLCTRYPGQLFMETKQEFMFSINKNTPAQIQPLFDKQPITLYPQNASKVDFVVTQGLLFDYNNASLNKENIYQKNAIIRSIPCSLSVGGNGDLLVNLDKNTSEVRQNFRSASREKHIKPMRLSRSDPVLSRVVERALLRQSDSQKPWSVTANNPLSSQPSLGRLNSSEEQPIQEEHNENERIPFTIQSLEEEPDTVSNNVAIIISDGRINFLRPDKKMRSCAITAIGDGIMHCHHWQIIPSVVIGKVTFKNFECTVTEISSETLEDGTTKKVLLVTRPNLLQSQEVTHLIPSERSIETETAYAIRHLASLKKFKKIILLGAKGGGVGFSLEQINLCSRFPGILHVESHKEAFTCICAGHRHRVTHLRPNQTVSFYPQNAEIINNIVSKGLKWEFHSLSRKLISQSNEIKEHCDGFEIEFNNSEGQILSYIYKFDKGQEDRARAAALARRKVTNEKSTPSPKNTSPFHEQP